MEHNPHKVYRMWHPLTFCRLPPPDGWIINVCIPVGRWQIRPFDNPWTDEIYPWPQRRFAGFSLRWVGHRPERWWRRLRFKRYIAWQHADAEGEMPILLIPTA